METDEIPEEQWGTTRPCPSCNGAMLPIAWGYPDAALFEAAERGEVFIGGCCITADRIPLWHCTACGREVDAPEGTTEA